MSEPLTVSGAPVLFVLWHRARRGAKWQKVGQFGSRAEALKAMGGSGDWCLAPLIDRRLAGNPGGEDADDRQAAERVSLPPHQELR